MAAGATNTLKNLYRLKVVNIPWTISDIELKQYFSQFGFVSNAKVMFDKNTGMNRGNGLIDLTNKDTYENILSNKNHFLEGHNIYIKKWID